MALECTRPVLSTGNGIIQKMLYLQEKELQLLSCLQRRKQFLSQKELGTKYEQRRECARQIYAMYNYFDDASPAVFASSIGILDTALMKVNIPRKYSSCFSAACFFIGSKWVEDEYQPSAAVLADLHYKQWKQVDLRRMEEKILDVLGWEMPRCSYLAFLPHMSHVLGQYHPSPPDLALVVRHAEHLLLQEFSFLFKPAAVALGALEHCCRLTGSFTHDMVFAVIELQDFAKVLDSELHEIGEVFNSELGFPHTELKSNKAYFPKVFEIPSDGFCPDYRLYNIPEERDAELDPKPRQHPLVCYQSSLDASISDYDTTDEETEAFKSDDDDGETCKSNNDKCLWDYCSEKSSEVSSIEHKVREGTDSSDCSYCTENEQDQTENQTNDCKSSNSVEKLTYSQTHKQQSAIVHQSSTVPQVAAQIHNSGAHFANDDDTIDHDSGCEQDSDVEDVCCEPGSHEQDGSSEQDSEECDPDSDYHDSSPCRTCLQNPCARDVKGTALLFDQ